MATSRQGFFKSTSPITLKEKLAALKNIPAFFKLVLQASPIMTVVTILLRLIRAAMPLLILYIGKLIIDEVVQLNRAPEAQEHDHLWKLVGLEFIIALLSDALGRAITLMDSLL